MTSLSDLLLNRVSSIHQPLTTSSPIHSPRDDWSDGDQEASGDAAAAAAMPAPLNPDPGRSSDPGTNRDQGTNWTNVIANAPQFASRQRETHTSEPSPRDEGHADEPRPVAPIAANPAVLATLAASPNQAAETQSCNQHATRPPPPPPLKPTSQTQPQNGLSSVASFLPPPKLPPQKPTPKNGSRNPQSSGPICVSSSAQDISQLVATHSQQPTPPPARSNPTSPANSPRHANQALIVATSIAAPSAPTTLIASQSIPLTSASSLFSSTTSSPNIPPLDLSSLRSHTTNTLVPHSSASAVCDYPDDDPTAAELHRVTHALEQLSLASSASQESHGLFALSSSFASLSIRHFSMRNYKTIAPGFSDRQAQSEKLM